MGEIILVKENRSKQNRLQKAYNTATRMAIKYGSPNKSVDGQTVFRYDEDDISKNWDYEDFHPPVFYFKRNTHIKVIRHIVKNGVELTHKIWNSDFIHGLCLNGEIKDTSDNKYCCLEWDSKKNKHIGKILRKCPFGGDVLAGKWKSVPILDVKHSDNTFSYMAGLFSAGEVVKRDGERYVSYSGKAKDEIIRRKIPIEYDSDGLFLISPIWPALFAPYMPRGIYRNKWKKLKDTRNGSFYSALLWKSYMNNSFPAKGLPFLKSRRSVYYNYKCDEGAMEKLESLRIETGLVDIDLIFRDIVQSWGRNI